VTRLLTTAMQGERQWTKRDKTSGQFMDNKKPEKFKGVRKEKAS
jgi:hypothetical protein